MKIFRKIISLILTAAVMMSMISAATVSVGAAEQIDAYIGHNGSNNFLTITGISDETVKYLNASKKDANITIMFNNYEKGEYCNIYYDVDGCFANGTGYTDNTFENPEYYPIETTGLKKNGIWEITFILDCYNDNKKLINFIQNTHFCEIQPMREDKSWDENKKYIQQVGISSYEDGKKQHEKDSALGVLGDPPTKSSVTNGNYNVKGYYNKDKTKYCVEISGISKQEYQYLWDCYNYYNKCDEIKGYTYTKRRIVIELTQYCNDEKIEINADIANNLFYLYKGETDTENYHWKTTSKDLSGNLIDNGDTYSYVFYIDQSTNKGKKIVKEITADGYHSDPAVTIMCTEEQANSEIELDGGKGMFANYSYYQKGWIYVEATNYTKSTGSVKGAIVDVSLSTSLGSNYNKKITSLTFSKISNKSYTGKAIKPAVTIKDGDKKLVKGTDYTVSYKNNTKIGTASVTIKGKGSYTGEKTLTFKIVPAKTTLKVSKKSDTKATFSWTAVKGAEKYQLYYSVDGGKTYKKYTTISGSKTSYTASKLDFKKYDYKFKLRAYDKVGKTTYYGSYSKIVSVK